MEERCAFQFIIFCVVSKNAGKCILCVGLFFVIFNLNYSRRPHYSTKERPFVMTYKKFKAYKCLLGNLGASEAVHFGSETPTCMLNISSLGSISANKTDLKLKWVEEQYPEIRPGGFYAPADCRPRHKVAILVPYRNRESNLALFLNHIHRFLMKQLLEYRIFVVEQYGTDKFNKGSLFNVGFLEAQRFGNWHCYIFHDVDLLPLNQRILYTCPRKPTHMSPAVESFQYELPYLQLFGGVTSMTPAHYITVNGYSNRYMDWGGEDDDMFLRIKAARLPVLRYNKTIGRYATLQHKRNSEDSNNAKLLRTTKKMFRCEGLSSINYILKKMRKRKLFTHILVDVYPRNSNKIF